MVKMRFAALGWLCWLAGKRIEPWPRFNSVGLEFIRKDVVFLSVLINLG